jgi:molybdate transport system substrate-binding protein
VASNATANAAVAANFTRPMQILTKRFKKKTGYTVKTSIASTGTLYAQISHGAPFDLFLAADAARPRRLEKNGLTVPNSRFTYAIGQLVLWSPGLSHVNKTTLQRSHFKHLAIANPRTAPYGAAAKQVLKHLSLWRKLKPRLVLGESINQTYQFVVSGDASLGLIARSQLQASTNGATWTVPQKLYPPLTQQAVQLKHGRNNPAARAFLHFLKTKARPVIKRFGYGLPDNE